MELGRLGAGRHLAVGGATVLVGVATALGLIGEDGSERFDAKQIVISPVGDRDLRVRETVDQDFGAHDRHGYQRIIPNDFGEVTDVSASSPDAPDQLTVTGLGFNTTIRVGDPDTTVSGRHRYVLEYTYPDTTLDDGILALDIIGNEERFETTRFEAIITGLELENPTCNVGSSGDVGGCELVDHGDVYRVMFEPLHAGDGVTIGGTVTGRRDVIDIAAPPPPSPKPNRRLPMTAGVLGTGAVVGAGGFALARRQGRNDVFAGGAADAAFGGAPPDQAVPQPAAAPIRSVPDAELAELATTEFAPPSDIDPWLGRVILGERFDRETVAAWLSGHAATNVLEVTKGEGDKVMLSKGAKFDRAPGSDRDILNTMLGSAGSVELGTYRKGFATGWNKAGALQRKTVEASGFWKRPLPGASTASSVGAGWVGYGVVGAIVLFALIALGSNGSPIVGNAVAPFVLVAGLTGAAALFAYRRLLPARTAIGSSYAIRTESFRRFLAASEAQHVEWAWERGVLREYSAWAVALGTADTWEAAVSRSSVPPDDVRASAAPFILFHSGAALSSTSTKPSSSGSGRGSYSGGGFSGGSVGGGGGGGSSGSW